MSLHAQLREHFAYLVDDAHGALLDAVILRANDARFEPDGSVMVRFTPHQSLFASPPARAPAGWPRSFDEAVSRHALLQFPDASGWALVLGDHGNAPGGLRSPLRDFSDWWVYEDDGQLAFVSHEGGGPSRPSPLSAGALFIRRMAEALGLPVPTLREEPQATALVAHEGAAGPNLDPAALRPSPEKRRARATALAFIDDDRLVVGAEDGTLTLFDARSALVLETWKPSRADRQPASGGFKLGKNGFMSYGSIAVSPDGTHLVTTHEQDGVRLWTIRPLRLVARGDGSPGCRAAIFSADGAFVIGKVGRHVWKWRREVREGVLALERGGDRFESGSTDLAAFSPDGTRVAFHTDDLDVRVVDVETQADVARIDARHETPYLNDLGALAFSRDGKQVLTGDLVGHVRVFDAATGASLAAYHRHESLGGRVLGLDRGTKLVALFDENGADVWGADGHFATVVPVRARLLAASPDESRLSLVGSAGVPVIAFLNGAPSPGPSPTTARKKKPATRRPVKRVTPSRTKKPKPRRQ
jgi:hypothetical protein